MRLVGAGGWFGEVASAGHPADGLRHRLLARRRAAARAARCTATRSSSSIANDASPGAPPRSLRRAAGCRWQCVQTLGPEALQGELGFTGRVMRENAKNYQLWNHRRLLALRVGGLARARSHGGRAAAQACLLARSLVRPPSAWGWACPTRCTAPMGRACSPAVAVGQPTPARRLVLPSPRHALPHVAAGAQGRRRRAGLCARGHRV